MNEIVALICTVVAVGISILSFLRSASDRRIDERIDLKLKADIAVMREQLTAIQTSLSTLAERDAELVRSAVSSTADAISRAARDMVGLSAGSGRRTASGEPRIPI